MHAQPSDLEYQSKQSWPTFGQVTFRDVELRYRPKTDLVLKKLSFEIEGGHKIGIVGRTGAGKSTISLALTRIVELEAGCIEIDGRNISNMKMDELREHITIIPQDSTLFTGTLRFNIDPKGQLKDDEVTELLLKAGLDDVLNRCKENAEGSKSGDGNARNGLDL